MGPPPANPASDPQFSHWEIPIQTWWAQNSGKYGVVTSGDKPASADDVHTSSSKPVISITEPDQETLYSPNQKINLKISNSGYFPLVKLDVFINDVYTQTLEAPFSFSFTPSQLENMQSVNEIKVIGYDSAYNHSEATSSFKVQQ